MRGIVLFGLLVMSIGVQAGGDRCGSYTYADMVRAEQKSGVKYSGQNKFHSKHDLKEWQDEMHWKVYDLNQQGRIQECVATMKEIYVETQIHINDSVRRAVERNRRYTENHRERYGACTTSPMFRFGSGC